MPTCLVQALPYLADPSRYFSSVMHAPGAVLLDAGRPTAQRGRYDLISAWPLAELAPAPDETANAFLQRLRQSLASLGECQTPADNPLPFVGGLIGYLSYDFGRRLEQLPAQAVDDLGLADARFGLYAWALITDHQQQSSQLMFHPSLAASERQRLSKLSRCALRCASRQAARGAGASCGGQPCRLTSLRCSPRGGAAKLATRAVPAALGQLWRVR